MNSELKAYYAALTCCRSGCANLRSKNPSESNLWGNSCDQHAPSESLSIGRFKTDGYTVPNILSSLGYDSTWHNDACPSVSSRTNTELQIFVDHRLEEERESTGACRFTVLLGCDNLSGEPWFLDTDSIAEVGHAFTVLEEIQD